ncbi:MAG: hypothetical protein NTW97_02470 [Candidatus Krumholzibacteria bacterium]|nr:hypothetical protein [Candidatus Krumholzibacteria bacterium]
MELPDSRGLQQLHRRPLPLLKGGNEMKSLFVLALCCLCLACNYSNANSALPHAKEVSYCLGLFGNGYQIDGASLGNVGITAVYFLNSRFGVGLEASFPVGSDTISNYSLGGIGGLALALHTNLNPNTRISHLDFPRLEMSLSLGYGSFTYSKRHGLAITYGEDISDDIFYFDPTLSLYWRISWSIEHDGSGDGGCIMGRVCSTMRGIISNFNGFDIGLDCGYRVAAGADNKDFSNVDLSVFHFGSYFRILFW